MKDPQWGRQKSAPPPTIPAQSFRLFLPTDSEKQVRIFLSCITQLIIWCHWHSLLPEIWSPGYPGTDSLFRSLFWLETFVQSENCRQWHCGLPWDICVCACVRVCVSCSVMPTPCDPLDCSCQAPLSMEFSRQENTGVGCHALLQGVFPTQGLNPGLPHYRQILYHLSYPFKQY